MAITSLIYSSVSLLLATFASLLFVSLEVSAVPCKIYPRILGSSDPYTTTIYSIDANLNEDRLVATGDTNDATLIGESVAESSVPFIAMYSISTTRIFYGLSDV